MPKHSPFRYFKSSPKIIRPALMRDVQFALSLWNEEGSLRERGIDVSHETYGFDGTDLVQCLRLISAEIGEAGCGPMLQP
jgi:putative transposase